MNAPRMTTTAGTCDCGDHWLLHDTGGCAYVPAHDDTTDTEESK